MAVTGAQLLAAALESDKTDAPRAPTSCRSIDKVLGGGFEFGKINSIAGDTNTGKTTVSSMLSGLHGIVLSEHEIAMHVAAKHVTSDRVSTVAFVDTGGSFSLVLLRDVIVHYLNKLQQEPGTSADQHSHSSLEDCLARIEILRCFDFAGLADAIEEVSAKYADLDREAGSQSPGRRVLIVDNIANVLDAEHTGDNAESASLFASFQWSLRRLTSRNRVCSLLINTVNSQDGDGPRHGSQYSETRGSAFLSMKQRPAHGYAYAHMIDLSILLFRLPKGREDAEARYAPDPGRFPRWESATVFEVLLDRGGSRDGQWNAFEVEGIELYSLDV